MCFNVIVFIMLRVLLLLNKDKEDLINKQVFIYFSFYSIILFCLNSKKLRHALLEVSYT